MIEKISSTQIPLMWFCIWKVQYKQFNSNFWNIWCLQDYAYQSSFLCCMHYLFMQLFMHLSPIIYSKFIHEVKQGEIFEKLAVGNNIFFFLFYFCLLIPIDHILMKSTRLVI